MANTSLIDPLVPPDLHPGDPIIWTAPLPGTLWPSLPQEGTVFSITQLHVCVLRPDATGRWYKLWLPRPIVQKAAPRAV